MIGRSYVKIPLRRSAVLNFENDDKHCFFWSKLASLHPCNNNNPNRASNNRQHFDELNFEQFDFSNVFQCSDVLIFEKLTNLSINISEGDFYQDRNVWKHKLFPNEVSKNGADRAVDLII